MSQGLDVQITFNFTHTEKHKKLWDLCLEILK